MTTEIIMAHTYQSATTYQLFLCKKRSYEGDATSSCTCSCYSTVVINFTGTWSDSLACDCNTGEIQSLIAWKSRNDICKIGTQWTENRVNRKELESTSKLLNNYPGPFLLSLREDTTPSYRNPMTMRDCFILFKSLCIGQKNLFSNPNLHFLTEEHQSSWTFFLGFCNKAGINLWFILSGHFKTEVTHAAVQGH